MPHTSILDALAARSDAGSGEGRSGERLLKLLRHGQAAEHEGYFRKR